MRHIICALYSNTVPYINLLHMKTKNYREIKLKNELQEWQLNLLAHKIKVVQRNEIGVTK